MVGTEVPVFAPAFAPTLNGLLEEAKEEKPPFKGSDIMTDRNERVILEDPLVTCPLFTNVWTDSHYHLTICVVMVTTPRKKLEAYYILYNT